MTELPENLVEMIQCGENTEVEFSRSAFRISKNVYRTVCAFSNRNGGHIFLGVEDDGEISGIVSESVSRIIDELAAVLGSGTINPPLLLSPKVYEYGGRTVIYIRVPCSNSVCRYEGRIYDRNYVSNIDITYNSDAVSSLYDRKYSPAMPYAGTFSGVYAGL